MSLQAWDDITFATPSQLSVKEIGKGSVLNTLYKDDVIEEVIKEGKAELLDLLKTDIPELYANRNGYLQLCSEALLREIGYSYTELDEMFDKIGNPECLERCARAKIITMLWIRLSNEDQPNLNFNLAYGTEQADKWEKRFKERYAQAKKQLWFDLNEDGVISDSERVRTKTRFKRG